MARELIHSLTRKDLRIDYFSGTGKGGQHRNKHQNCVRITHPETGITAQCTEHRERTRNLQVAFSRFAAKLLQHLRAEAVRARYPAPDEYVRTYHAVENRVIDHVTGHRADFESVVFGDALGEIVRQRTKGLKPS